MSIKYKISNQRGNFPENLDRDVGVSLSFTEELHTRGGCKGLQKFPCLSCRQGTLEDGRMGGHPEKFVNDSPG